MKLPKETNRFCQRCKKHTAHKISIAKQKSRSASHPLSRGSNSRLFSRGLKSGMGNKGRNSKPAVKNWKRKTKVTKRMTLMYTCSQCKKSFNKNKSIRAGRIEIGEKVAK
jgi:large subunit ribosomal protein L44e